MLERIDEAMAPVLESKLQPLLGARAPIERPRLMLPAEILGGRIKAVVVAAPAGYGKSTLMAQWFESLQGERAPGVSSAWLNLDENDNDPLRLLRYLIAALRVAIPDLGRDATLDFQAPSTTEALLDAIGARLAGVDSKIVLFMDDAHVLRDRQALGIIEWLVRYAADNLRFVIGGRHAPRVGISQLRLRGELAEVDQSALAFTSAEAAAFWAQRRLAPLDGCTQSALLEKTEGWAAAIELLALALSDAPDTAQLIADFSGTNREVVEYLGEVVFGRLATQQHEHIYRLAQFDRFCADLAAQVCGPDVAAGLLDELQRRRLFLIPLDRQGQWFRFHHLVRDYLRRQVPPRLATAMRESLLAGGHWFQAQGFSDDAIDCAVRAREWDLACRWLAACVDGKVPRGRSGANLSRWIPLIPRDQINRYPQIRISYMILLAYFQQRELLERELADFDALIEAWQRSSDKDPTLIDTMRSAVTLQKLMWRGLRDECQGMLPQVQAWLEHCRSAYPRGAGDALSLAAYAAKTAGEIDLGLEYSRRAQKVNELDGFGVSRGMLLASLLWLKRGDYRAAQAVTEGALRLVAERLNGHPEQAAHHHGVLAAIHYELDETTLAGQELESELAAVDATGIADVLILLYLTRARLQFLRGDRDAGIEALRLGRALGVRRDLPRVTITLAGEECIWNCRFGEQAAAFELARQFGFDRTDAVIENMQADRSARAGARVALAKAPEVALVRLAPALRRSERKGFHYRRVELLILQAMALVACNREAEAADAWRTALQLGEQYGYRRVFFDDADIVANLSHALKGHKAVPRPVWLRTKPKAVVADTEEVLTRKELRILKHLESGRSNREIAESLFISESTLKWHLHNLYRKLACKNRTGALSAARHKGIL
ncbi:MAG TPA: LuxR C-terminal-related transcriptional regulator [Steroidobacter sp.]|uniref:helix-turn-helix transcriptional regulator n=1 Tax=Steroidobacter sp. TaxID=1978227 RepID=UPI002ED80D59